MLHVSAPWSSNWFHFTRYLGYVFLTCRKSSGCGVQLRKWMFKHGWLHSQWLWSLVFAGRWCIDLQECLIIKLMIMIFLHLLAGSATRHVGNTGAESWFHLIPWWCSIAACPPIKESSCQTGVHKVILNSCWKSKKNHILPQRAQGIRYGKLIFSRGSCKRAHDVFIFSGWILASFRRVTYH